MANQFARSIEWWHTRRLNREADSPTGETRSFRTFVVAGWLGMLAAIPITGLIFFVNERFVGQPEKTVSILGVVFLIGSAILPSVYLLRRRQFADPKVLGLLVMTGVSVTLVSIYLYWVSFYVRFPADILTWSESDFVNDILKFRIGYPMYSAQQNNDSFTYMPGAQLVTFLLAWLSGNALSIPVYRAIQLGFTVVAAGVGIACIQRLVTLSQPNQRGIRWAWSGAFYLPVLFLFASNSITNPFVFNLHNDALAQLIAVAAFLLLLVYVATRRTQVLALMALIPALGFAVKQNLAVWAVFYSAFLFIFDQPRSIRRAVAVTGIAFGLIGGVFGVGYLLWGGNFIYWTITVLGSRGVSPLRSLQHIFDVWPHLAMGLIGGWLLLRGKSFDRLLGPWLIWLGFMLIEIWSSGTAWMLNHIGSGSLIAGVWFLAGIQRNGFANAASSNRPFTLRTWLRTGVGVAVLALFFSALGLIRLPLQPFNDAPYTYAATIEKEFDGQAAKDILLDVGTWVYVKDGVIMQDRAPSIGERGYSGTGDFSALVARIQQKRYSKILVRELHQPDFWYDYSTWQKSSGIRQALENNYHEIRTIAPVTDAGPGWLASYGFSAISVLVPNSN